MCDSIKMCSVMCDSIGGKKNPFPRTKTFEILSLTSGPFFHLQQQSNLNVESTQSSKPKFCYLVMYDRTYVFN